MNYLPNYYNLGNEDGDFIMNEFKKVKPIFFKMIKDIIITPLKILKDERGQVITC